jgi:hypothetical protein
MSTEMRFSSVYVYVHACSYLQCAVITPYNKLIPAVTSEITRAQSIHCAARTTATATATAAAAIRASAPRKPQQIAVTAIGVTAVGVTVVQSAHCTAVCAVVDAAVGCVQCTDCYKKQQVQKQLKKWCKFAV